MHYDITRLICRILIFSPNSRLFKTRPIQVRWMELTKTEHVHCTMYMFSTKTEHVQCTLYSVLYMFSTLYSVMQSDRNS